MFPYLRRKEELCCFLLTRQVYGRKGLLCRSSHEEVTKMAVRFLEIRRRLHVAFSTFSLFTWNVEFLQTFASNLFVINKVRFFGHIFLVRKRWVHETSSCTRINWSCKQSIDQQNSAKVTGKRRFESFHQTNLSD